ncbi:MAG: glycosyltransferase [Candidatus Omnitrophica bacterium]|nr:glycosyltransferase [Candidatus Omnitrophota bacterium]
MDKETVRKHFDLIAKDYDEWKKKNSYYYNELKSFIRRIVRPKSSVLDIGTGTGEILAALEPSLGVGIGISHEMVKRAKEKFPELNFIAISIEEFRYPEKFDYIVMIDLIDHAYDIIDILENVHTFCHHQTKVIITTINPWWEPLLLLMEKLRQKMPEGPHNFIERRNLSKIIEFLDFSVAETGYLLLFPKYIPILSRLANRLGVKIWGVNKFSFVHYTVLRPLPENNTDLGLGCSVIIPCYNEEANIEEAVRRVPRMGKHTEIIVVNDGSTDRTSEAVQRLLGEFPDLKLIDYSPRRGKGYAVKKGFESATQEVVMILDADMSVMPEELPRFFKLLNKGVCDFVNGTRMVYHPMQEQAMRFWNLLGNKIFSLILTFITGQHLTDTLCGTKAMYKKDFQYIKMGIDKWGDFDLLFGAARLGNKIMEIPVHYAARRSGESKMKTFRHGLHLLKGCFRGFKEVVLRR